jgi:uncharacterized Zn finger protein (UPF0148 family)
MTYMKATTSKTALKNTGRLLSVYCPHCGRVTDKVSFNLLRETGKVKASCPVCQGVTVIEYDGKTASLWHVDEAHERIFRELAASLELGSR